MTLSRTSSEATRRLQAEIRRKLPFLLDFGDENDITELARAYDPRVSEQQLKRIIKLFLDAKRERARSRQSH